MSSKILPKVMARNSVIGIVSPSSAVAAMCPRRFERAIQNLQDLGFKTLVGPNARTRSQLGYAAGNLHQRADDLNAMFSDPKVDAVMTTIGGTAVNHILDHLDLSLIAANPKFLIGYSDITLLQAALWHRIKLVSIAGPALLPQFGEPEGPHWFTWEAFQRIATTAEPVGLMPASRTLVSDIQRWDIDDNHPRKEQPIAGPRTFRPGKAAGWLAPVNLESLLALSATDWYPDLTGALLVLEASESTSAPRFHQGLYQLRGQGVFDRIHGLAIGRFDSRSGCSPQMLNAILLDVLEAPDYPIICDLDFGHTDPLLSIPWGIQAELNAAGNCPVLVITEAAGTARKTEMEPSHE
jgi:muramoyltetrapeptide carboxypeptidase